MLTLVDDKLLEAECFGDDRVVREFFVDIHCHCLADIDDGPATMAESIALCRALADDGITTVIATPHQLGRFSECNDAAQIREAVCRTNEELVDNEIDLHIVPGGDVRVDERICQLLADDKILTLADGGKYILLELPYEASIDIRPLFGDLASMGVGVVLSHPERYPHIAAKPETLLGWLECSAHLQVTAGSLLGAFGPVVEMLAWRFLSAGWISLVATDCHNLHRRKPCMHAAYRQIRARLGQAVARLLCIENPLRVLRGRPLQFCSSIRRISRDAAKAIRF